MSCGRIWSNEEREYLEMITPGHHYSEIQQLMIKKFKIDYSVNQIKNAIARYKLNTGFNGRFEKGNIPANKGVKGACSEGCKKTWFKKGQMPANHKPVGSERTNVDGYVEIKIREPNKWDLKHRVIYRKEKGEIPKGYSVIFGDRNRANFDIDNLILVSRQQLIIMNKNKLIKSNTELTKTGLLIADVYNKISEKKKKGD